MTAEKVIWLSITVFCGLLFCGIGVYARNRKKPMWFNSSSPVRENEISDIPAYNRENGIMWIAYSGVFWVSAVLGFYKIEIAGAVLAAGCLGGIPALCFAYKRIYEKYKK